MLVYADYEFYRNTYQGEMDEKDFQRYVVSATSYIRYLTMGKADAFSGNELKYAVCEAADIYLSAVCSEKADQGIKKSETTDGYSVSYVVEGKDGETKEMLANRKAYGVIRRWLLPTGLLNRKVGCAHDHQHRSDHLSPQI